MRERTEQPTARWGRVHRAGPQGRSWATLVQRRNKPELYDVFSTGITMAADPALTASLKCDWPEWWCQEEKDRLYCDLVRESDTAKRKALIDRIQAIFYDDVGSPQAAPRGSTSKPWSTSTP